MKNFTDRYKRIAESDHFKKAYENKSIGDQETGDVFQMIYDCLEEQNKRMNNIEDRISKLEGKLENYEGLEVYEIREDNSENRAAGEKRNCI